MKARYERRNEGRGRGGKKVTFSLGYFQWKMNMLAEIGARKLVYSVCRCYLVFAFHLSQL